MESQEIERLIREAMGSDAEVAVQGDGRHFQALIVSSAFEGVQRIKRHRMVLDALRDRIDSDQLHAISMRTMTPDERSRQQGAG